jgi:hypothetical protein
MGRVGQADTTDSRMFHSGRRMGTPTREHGSRGTSEPPSEPEREPLSELRSEPGTSQSIYTTVII